MLTVLKRSSISYGELSASDFSSYAALFVFIAAINGGARFLHPERPRLVRFHMATFTKDTYTLDSSIFGEIVGASILSLVLSIIWLYISNNKLPVRFMQKIKATRRFGDEDIWDFTFNSGRAEAEYIHVRDFENELTYSGWVELFSETGSTRELLLRNVVVSSLDGANQYETPRLYIGRAMDNIAIEFPYLASEHQEKRIEPEASGAERTTDGT